MLRDRCRRNGRNCRSRCRRCCRRSPYIDPAEYAAGTRPAELGNDDCRAMTPGLALRSSSCHWRRHCERIRLRHRRPDCKRRQDRTTKNLGKHENSSKKSLVNNLDGSKHGHGICDCRAASLACCPTTKHDPGHEFIVNKNSRLLLKSTGNVKISDTVSVGDKLHERCCSGQKMRIRAISSGRWEAKTGGCGPATRCAIAVAARGQGRISPHRSAAHNERLTNRTGGR